eukprot:scaffold121149_cov24-Prasinocladus_malaysianus.AAC.2
MLLSLDFPASGHASVAEGRLYIIQEWICLAAVSFILRKVTAQDMCRPELTNPESIYEWEVRQKSLVLSYFWPKMPSPHP